jgi:isoquinoline 1-oxidoreductase beta subunit
MKNSKENINRRSFLRSSALAGGGLLIQFNWLTSNKKFQEKISDLNEVWVELSSFIKITSDNQIKIFCPNPEFGQNVMTSLPMIVAEELDIDWKKVEVEMAIHDLKFGGQFTGGSRSVGTYWKPLREAGATARDLLRQAAASRWSINKEDVKTQKGYLIHSKTGEKLNYGEVATQASTLPTPKNVPLKAIKDFNIINHSQKNVEGDKVIQGKPIFSMDYKEEGMKIAMVVHPPAFGKTIDNYDASSALKMPGIIDIFPVKLYPDGSERGPFETRSFNEVLAIVGNSTWEVMNARKSLKINWKERGDFRENVKFGPRITEDFAPGSLESTDKHFKKLEELNGKPAELLRKDGDPETAFYNAKHIIERTYHAPFLAHNPMEPVNCFAHVTENHAKLVGPLQAPNFAINSIASALGISADKIEIKMARMGGGFGRRAYPHYMVEAALISKKVQLPIKLIYTREDDMTYGIYRPMYTAVYRAAFDANKNLIGFHIKGGGIPENPIHANRFPAGAIDNYLAEGYSIPSNITIGAFRAPRSNFNAAAEQSFLDEVAEYMGEDPIDFRIRLLEKAKANPIGERNDYDADRYAGVLKLVKEKSNWGKETGVKRGVAAYFCHASYAAHVVDLIEENGMPIVKKVTSAVDCGVVVNPDAAKNMTEGAVVDGIGNAMYGQMTFQNGVPNHENFTTYRMIRHYEAPKEIDVHFVKNEIDPTGMGEPPFPPVIPALANALYQLTGKRYYKQPFS